MLQKMSFFFILFFPNPFLSKFLLPSHIFHRTDSSKCFQITYKIRSRIPMDPKKHLNLRIPTKPKLDLLNKILLFLRSSFASASLPPLLLIRRRHHYYPYGLFFHFFSFFFFIVSVRLWVFGEFLGIFYTSSPPHTLNHLDFSHAASSFVSFPLRSQKNHLHLLFGLCICCSDQCTAEGCCLLDGIVELMEEEE